MGTISENLQSVCQKITDAERKYGRIPGTVKLLAVSKTKPVAMLLEAIAHGQLDFGENYLQDALPKINTIANPAIKWHFIGHMQSNKCQMIAQNFDWAHTVSSIKTARLLNKHRPPDLPKLKICLQINISNESGKSGCTANEALDIACESKNLARLHLAGLMCIPAPQKEFERQRTAFAQLKETFDRMNQQGLALDNLSMGMSNDLTAAIAEGATIVRVGTDIFGARNTI